MCCIQVVTHWFWQFVWFKRNICCTNYTSRQFKQWWWMQWNFLHKSYNQWIFSQRKLKWIKCLHNSCIWWSSTKLNDLLTSTRFFNVIMSRGKWRSRFLCKSNDFKLVRRAMLAGSISIKLSHNVSACNCCKLPTVSGTSVIKFPPRDNTFKLCMCCT